MDGGVLGKLRSAAGAASRDPLGVMRDAARLPLERQAAARIAALPVVEVADLTGDAEQITVALPPRTSRHAWSLGAAEQMILQAIVKARACTTAFEIGTFNGGTTRLLAEALPDHGRVWTIDLPEQEFDSTQSPRDFTGRKVGVAYRDSTASPRITQLYGNSLTFDFSEFGGSADLVLVDGGHEYEHGLADSATALALVKAGGVVLWDDFEPYWHGLVNGICEAMEGRRLGRLAGTSLAVYVNEVSDVA